MLRSPLAPDSGTVATARIRVLLCDDHKLVRRGLHALLDADLTQEVVGEASSADEAVEIAVTLTPDVVAGRGETSRYLGSQDARRMRSRFHAEMRTMGRKVTMTIEWTAYERPRRLASLTRLSGMDIRGDLRFDPVAGGTRMRWAWDLEPHGGVKLMGPMITLMGRRQERTIWSSLKRVLEAPETSVAPA